MTATIPINDIRNGRYAVPLWLALIAAGLAGNHFPFPILNAHFIFGSIFAMLTLQFLGWGKGVIAAAAISGYTCLTWNHPWAFVTMTGEAAVVGWLFTRRRVALVTADALYWIILGIPLGFSCFHILAAFPVSSSLFLITKQAFNGITNALVSRLVFTRFSWRWHRERISLHESVSTPISLLIVLTSMVLVTQDAGSDLAETDRRIRADLIRTSRSVTDGVSNWLAEKREAIVHLARLAATLTPSEMQARLEQADASDPAFLRMCLLDREGIAVAYSPKVDELGRPTIGKSFADRPYLTPLRQSLKPMLSEVMPSRFGRTGSVVILLAPVLSDGSYDGAVGGIMDFDRIRAFLEKHVLGLQMQYTLVDKNGNVILSNRMDQEIMKPFSMEGGSFEPLTGLHRKSLPPITRSKASLSDAEEGILHWVPHLAPSASTLDLWGKSVYVAESAIGDLGEWRLILGYPVEPFQKNLYDEYSQKFFVFFVILIASLVVAAWVSRRTVTAIEDLGLATRNLLARLESGEQIAWPEIDIQEIQHLREKFRQMADSLRERFLDVRRLNESLEQKVGERTNALVEANRRLRASQVAMLSILEDLKSENRARREKEVELKKVNMAIEQAGEVILITDVAGTIQYANPAFETVTGYTREEAYGQNPRLLKSGVQDKAFYQDLWETITAGRVWRGRFVNKRKDGKLYTEASTISPVLDETGRIINYVAVKRDITRQLELTTQLQQSQKLESVGRLAAGIAHDFNNLLTPIIGNADLLLSELGRGDPLREIIEEIRGAGVKAASLIRHLLAFSRKQILQPEILDLNQVLRDMEKMVRRIIGEDIQMEMFLSPDLGRVQADVGQVEQVLMNLVVNARDAMPRGGRLTIETVNVELDDEYARAHIAVTPGSYVMLAVSDTGVGMTQEVRERLYEPFFTTKGKEKGTGLGLSTVYGIVKQSGGNIWVYSEPGLGSTFKVYLPRVEGRAPAPEKSKQEESLWGSGTVLVVEDDEGVRNMTLKALQNYGYTVLCAGNGEEALRIGGDHGAEIRLMLTDVVMPGVDFHNKWTHSCPKTVLKT
jgi:PAS domain S-box-containing protein